MKRDVIQKVIATLEAELERQARANVQSNEATAFSAAGAEKQRDTTGFEAAHLARGYANHAQELRHQIDVLRAMPVEDFSGQEIDIGALVEVEMGGETDCYFLLNCGGGTEVEVDGELITVITPESPLGAALMGNIEAGVVALPTGTESIILSVW
jgi:transcription elongation GreA/GreB family factor